MANLISPLLWQYVPFKDPDAYLDWHRQHEADHIALSAAGQTPFSCLDDMRDMRWFDQPEEKRKTFKSVANLLTHQRMHDALAQKYNIDRVLDLLSYDLNNEDDFIGFMQLHALDHFRFRQAAGL
jgi:hypothetical protein